MAILNIVPFQPAGQVGVEPYWISILTSDTVATVTTTGYLTTAAKSFGYTFSDKQMALVYTSDAKNQVLQVVVTATGVVSLAAPDVSVEDLIVESLEITAPTAAKGNILFVAADNTGDTTTTITNAEFGQATVLTIPDPDGATSNFLVSSTAFVDNTLLAADGTTGKVKNSGVLTSAVQLAANIKAATTANIGGAGAGPLTVAVAGLTAASVVVATVESSSNPVSVIACTAGTNSFDVTLSADPGASCLLNYVAFIAAQ